MGIWDEAKGEATWFEYLANRMGTRDNPIWVSNKELKEVFINDGVIFEGNVVDLNNAATVESLDVALSARLWEFEALKLIKRRIIAKKLRSEATLTGLGYWLKDRATRTKRIVLYFCLLYLKLKPFRQRLWSILAIGSLAATAIGGIKFYYSLLPTISGYAAWLTVFVAFIILSIAFDHIKDLFR